MIYHTPVLLEESVTGLDIKPDGIYVDLTFGGGGHAAGVLKKLGKKGRLLAFDQDMDANQNTISDKRFTFIKSNFRFLKNFLRYYKIEKIDGLLADLGISSHQIDMAERGFSFMKDADLDMRMNQGSNIRAYDIINDYSEEELTRVFREYGELPNAKALAGKVMFMRNKSKIKTTGELAEGLSSLLPFQKRNKSLAQVFQSLRIEVNGEIEALKELLLQLPGFFLPGGRAVFITYHSLEDRMVKNFFKTGDLAGAVDTDFYGNVSAPFRLLNKSGTVPSEEEINKNPRARSARLRIAEKTDYAG